VAHLVEAMRILESRGSPAGLVLIGDGPLSAALREQARALKRVSFLGWLPAAALRGWMRGAAAVCVPSVTARSGDAEGMPNVVIEAMAEAAPVVASRSAGIAEAIEDEVTGLLVPPGDPRAIADALQRLIETPERRRRMGLAARAVAAERFEARQQSRRLERALLDVIEGLAS
jgi:glycosyltransferase involved in cell wall biosynthesis